MLNFSRQCSIIYALRYSDLKGPFVERSCPYQKRKQPSCTSEFDEIADNIIVNINLNIVGGGSTKTIIIWFANQSRGSFQYSCQ